MILSRSLIPALALSMMTVVAFAADTQATPRCGGFVQSLAPEARLMLFAQTRQETATMTDGERRDYRKAQREKFAAMPEADKQKLAAGLKAKWDALPADRKAQLKQQAEQARLQHPMMARMAARRGC